MNVFGRGGHWYKQPPQPILASRFWINRGLKALAVPGQPETFGRATGALSGSFALSQGVGGRSALAPASQVAGKYEYAVAVALPADMTFLVYCTTGNQGDLSGIASQHFIAPSALNTLNVLSVGDTVGLAFLDGNSSGSYTYGTSKRPRLFAGVRRGSSCEFWVEHRMVSSGTTGTRDLATTSILAAGRDSGNNVSLDAHTYLMALFDRALTEAEFALLADNPWRLFEPLPERYFFAAVAYQYARPSSDVAANGWLPSSGGDLFAMLDETSADDADYIYSPDNPTAQQFEIKLSPTTKPPSGSAIYFSLRLEARGLDTAFDIDFVEGSTIKDSWSESVTVAQGAETRPHTVASSIVDAMSNFNDLRIRGVARAP